MQFAHFCPPGLLILLALLNFQYAASAQVLNDDASPALPEAEGGAFNLLRHGDYLYIVTSQFMTAGEPHPILAWNIRTLQFDPDWKLEVVKTTPGSSSAISVLATDGTYLYVGGLFTEVNGVSRNNLAAVSLAGHGSTGAVDQDWAPNPNARIRELEYRAGRLYVAGAFDTIGTPARSHKCLAAVHPAGGGSLGAVDTSWLFPTSIPISDLTLGQFVVLDSDADFLYVAGPLASLSDSVFRSEPVAMSLADGVSPAVRHPHFNPGVWETRGVQGQGVIRRVLATPEAIYVAGRFSEVFHGPFAFRLSTPRINVAALYPPHSPNAGQVIPDWDVGLINGSQQVDDLAIYRGTLILGGGVLTTTSEFGHSWITTLMQVGLADTGGAQSAWRPEAIRGVYDVLPHEVGWTRAVEVFESGVFAAGDFDHVNGQPREGLALFLDTSSASSVWTRYP